MTKTKRPLVISDKIISDVLVAWRHLNPSTKVKEKTAKRRALLCKIGYHQKHEDSNNPDIPLVDGIGIRFRASFHRRKSVDWYE